MNKDEKVTSKTGKIKPTNIHKGHRERLRDEFFEREIDEMKEDKILEMILTFVQPRKDVSPIARALLEQYQNLSNVFDSEPKDLQRISGVGPSIAAFLNCCAKMPEIIKFCRNNLKKVRLVEPTSITNFLTEHIDFGSKERFYYLSLNGRGELIHFGSIGSGSSNRLYVNTQDLLKKLLLVPTHSVVICHTHPYGRANPSEADINFTTNLISLFDKLNIRLCDHIILAPEDYFSFFENHLVHENPIIDQIEKLKQSLFDKGFGYGGFEEEDSEDSNKTKPE